MEPKELIEVVKAKVLAIIGELPDLQAQFKAVGAWKSYAAIKHNLSDVFALVEEVASIFLELRTEFYVIF